MQIIQSLLNGALLGGLYAMVALGMSLVFGIMKLTNIAHGDLIIVSTYLCMVMAVQFGGNLLMAVLITICLMMLIGFFLQTFLINKVLDKGPEPPLLVTFGVSITLSNILLLVFGADARYIPNTLKTINIVNTEHFSISAIYLLNFIVAIVVICVLHYIMNSTFFGRSIRATADDVTTAELMGVNTKRIYSYTMCLAMLISSIAGLLVGMNYTFYPSTGTEYLIFAFGVVVIGGMGNIMGILLGGIILGLAQLLGAYFFGTGYQLLAGYLVLLIILTIRPQGILSKGTRK